jgi:cold-inducible RNA-binding protein
MEEERSEIGGMSVTPCLPGGSPKPDEREQSLKPPTAAEGNTKTPMATKLFVGNLSFNTTEGDILDLFKQAGNVTSCELIMDKFTGKSRGFAFVQMGTQEEANKAVTDFNGKELDGRALTVNEARPREERPRGDFGGGGGGGGFGGGGGRGGGGGGKRDFGGGGRGRR